ncbi:MAG TPA: VWA domain-containing protein [Thermoanaerobaculia bacterium]
MSRPGRISISAAILGALLAAAAGTPAAARAARAAEAAGAPGGGTPPLPSFAERVDVRQVNLEVFVTDAQGRAVTDLTASDFRVFEDGSPVALQSFSWVDGGKGAAGRPAPGSQAAGAADETPVRAVVVLDEEHTRAPDRAALFARLGEVLAGRLPHGSQVTIWRYNGGMSVLLPFTGERHDILATLAKEAATFSARQIYADEDRLSTLAALHEDALAGPCLYGEQIARAYAERQRAEVLRDVDALGRLVGTLEGLAGRKLLLYVSDGIPLRPGEEAWATFLELCGGSGQQSGVKGAMDVGAMSPELKIQRPDPAKLRLEALTYDTSKEWEALTARANGQGLSLYSLVTGGPASLSSAIQNESSGPSAIVLGGEEDNRLDAVFFLAAETGGRLVYNGRDVEQALGGIVDDLSYYLLGYPAPDPTNGRIRRLRVEVARAGLRVRHRRTYALESEDQRASDRLLTRLYYDVGENPLGLKLTSKTAGPRERATTTRLQLTVPLSGLALLPASDAEPRQLQGRITVYLVSRDGEGNTSPVRRRVLPLRFPAAEAESVRQRTFLYEVAMQLRQGRNDLAVAVRDDVTGEISFAGQVVTMPR